MDFWIGAAAFAHVAPIARLGLRTGQTPRTKQKAPAAEPTHAPTAEPTEIETAAAA